MVAESILPRLNDEVVLMQSACFHKYVKIKQCFPEQPMGQMEMERKNQSTLRQMEMKTPHTKI